MGGAKPPFFCGLSRGSPSRTRPITAGEWGPQISLGSRPSRGLTQASSASWLSWLSNWSTSLALVTRWVQALRQAGSSKLRSQMPF